MPEQTNTAHKAPARTGSRTTKEPPSHPPAVMTLQDICAYARVGPRTIKEWMTMDPDPLPYQRTGPTELSHLLFRRDLFDDWQRRQMGAAIRKAS